MTYVCIYPLNNSEAQMSAVSLSVLTRCGVMLTLKAGEQTLLPYVLWFSDFDGSVVTVLFQNLILSPSFLNPQDQTESAGSSRTLS